VEEKQNQHRPRRPRKRIPPTHVAHFDQQASFSDNVHAARLHDLEVKCIALEKRYRTAVLRMENYHMEMQQANSERLKNEKKIRNVLKHVQTTVSASEVPGAAPAANPQEQELRLLKWKLKTIENYLYGVFPEHVSQVVVIKEENC
jgi:hypothetical protein